MDQFTCVAQVMRNWTQTTGRRHIGQESRHSLATFYATFNSTLVVQRMAVARTDCKVTAPTNRVLTQRALVEPEFGCWNGAVK